MKKIILMLAILSFSLPVHSQNEQSYLAILAETKLMVIPGMPVVPDLPAGTGMPAITLPGKPYRTLDIRLWSPGIAPTNATAEILIPEGLKQGNKLSLELYRPKFEYDDTPLPQDGKEFAPDKNETFTIKIYWGSSETVKPGQPKIITWDSLMADAKESIKKIGKEMQNANYTSYFYKPNWTTAHWPVDNQLGIIGINASLPGKYTLNTNYTGTVSIDAPDNVNFLDPILMSSPNLGKNVSLDEAIYFKWKAVENALGMHASIIGMEGKDTMVIWSSSEVYNEDIMGDYGFMQMVDIEENVENKVFLKGDTTAVTVPKGIFADSEMPMMTVIGFGPKTSLDEGQPRPRIQTKTSLNILLGNFKEMSDDEDYFYGDSENDEAQMPPAPSLDDIREMLDAIESSANMESIQDLLGR